MKVLFLDVDGVLNCLYCKEKNAGIIFVMPSKLELLKQLVDRTGAKIVLSSTWRQGWSDIENGINTRDSRDFVALRDKLKEYGIEMIGYTPLLAEGMDERGKEIGMWLENWQGEPIESMAILDDLNGCYLRPYAKYLVQTSFLKGLEQKHVEKAVKMLR